MQTKELTYEEKRQIVQKEFDDFVQSSPQLQSPEALKRIEKAFALADDAHKKQFRKTGQKLPYIIHPIAVAKIVTNEMGLGVTTAVAALLHDVVEDSKGKYTVEDIKNEFGEDVAGIVAGVTKIMEGFDPASTVQVETFKNFINYMSSDLRTAYVKIADRLHNLRTFEGMAENTQMIKTAEAYDIYAPLAYLLGLFEIKKELEDLSFEYRMSVEYERTKEKKESSEEERLALLNEVIEKIKAEFPKNQFRFRTEITQRSLYRAWRVSQRKKISFKDIHNFNSVRIIISPDINFSEKQQCYLAYSSLTDIFPARSHTFKDWVTAPKSNGFQAIISDIMYKSKWVEVQIMTERMHLISKRGFAEEYDKANFDNVYRWVRSVKEALGNKELSKNEVIELIRPQYREIYALTPKGKIIKLPKDATVLDFAFHVHTSLGLHCRAAEVNGKLVNYDFKLKNADQVNILKADSIIADDARIKALSSTGYRNLLKQQIRKQEKENIKKGMSLFERFYTKYKLNDADLIKLKNKFHCKSDDELFLRIANATVKEEDIALVVKNRKSVFGIVTSFWNSDNKTEYVEDLEFNPKKKFLVKNLDNIEIAKCCEPVSGDIAIVFRQNKQTFILHRNECPKAKSLNSTDGKNTAKVFWDLAEQIQFDTKISFSGMDTSGLLAEVIEIISKEQLNMTSLKVNLVDNMVTGTIALKVSDVKKIKFIVKEIRKIKSIKKAFRVDPKV